MFFCCFAFRLQEDVWNRKRSSFLMSSCCWVRRLHTDYRCEIIITHCSRKTDYKKKILIYILYYYIQVYTSHHHSWVSHALFLQITPSIPLSLKRRLLRCSERNVWRWKCLSHSNRKYWLQFRKYTNSISVIGVSLSNPHYLCEAARFCIIGASQSKPHSISKCSTLRANLC